MEIKGRLGSINQNISADATSANTDSSTSTGEIRKGLGEVKDAFETAKPDPFQSMMATPSSIQKASTYSQQLNEAKKEIHNHLFSPAVSPNEPARLQALNNILQSDEAGYEFLTGQFSKLSHGDHESQLKTMGDILDALKQNKDEKMGQIGAKLGDPNLGSGNSGATDTVACLFEYLKMVAKESREDKQLAQGNQLDQTNYQAFNDRFHSLVDWLKKWPPD